MSAPGFDAAVVVGRFQPLHEGHLALVRRALELAPCCVLVLGSAHQARTPKAPFSDEERAAMWHEALPAAWRPRVQLLPLRDDSRPARWQRRLQRAVPGRVVLVGGAGDDPCRAWQHALPGWAYEPVPTVPDADSAALRDAVFEGTLAGATGLPAAMRAFLQRWQAGAPALPALTEEWQQLRAYRTAWAAAPYPPVFVTVDAVVSCAGHVLLIRRAHAPGRGLHAVPGGFIEPRETALQSALRELAEETHLAVPVAELQQALRAQAVFDDPERSQRGRTITHAFHFELGERPLPAVRADDDAQSVEWVPLAALRGIEDRFHDDHFLMLDHFLGLTADGDDQAA